MDLAAIFMAGLLLTTGAPTLMESIDESHSVRKLKTDVKPPGRSGTEILVVRAVGHDSCGVKRSDYRVKHIWVETKAVLTAALHRMLSPQNRLTKEVVQSVTIEDGVATIDFLSFPSSAGASCGGTMFWGSLNSTVFQFDSVRAARYRFNGSCETFYRVLQSTCRGGPNFDGVFTRNEWERSALPFSK